MVDPRRGAKRWRRSFSLVVALIALSGCTGGSDGPERVGVGGYSAVIDEFLPPVPDEESRPVVYVARLAEDPFALEDQVAMIQVVEETHDLRFVDDIVAAIDDEDPEAPPRDDGLLFAIGTISTSPPHVVRVEVYSAADRIDAYKVSLSVRDDVWQVDATEPVDPEVLLGDE